MQVEMKNNLGKEDCHSNFWLAKRVRYTPENLPQLHELFSMVGENSVAAVCAESNEVWVIGKSEDSLLAGFNDRGLLPETFCLFHDRSSFELRLPKN